MDVTKFFHELALSHTNLKANSEDPENCNIKWNHHGKQSYPVLLVPNKVPSRYRNRELFQTYKESAPGSNGQTCKVVSNKSPENICCNHREEHPSHRVKNVEYGNQWLADETRPFSPFNGPEPTGAQILFV